MDIFFVGWQQQQQIVIGKSKSSLRNAYDVLCCSHENVISVINICNHFHCIEFILLFCLGLCAMHCFSCDNDFQLSRYFSLHSVSLQTKVLTLKNLATKKMMTINKTPFFQAFWIGRCDSLSVWVEELVQKRTTFGYSNIYFE